MGEVFETRLPGVGLRFDFTTGRGRRVGVVAHRSGRREIVVYDQNDPDTGRSVLDLDPEDGRLLVELLGGSKVSEELVELRQQVQGLVIEWITIETSSELAGNSIAQSRVRTRTGSSIVAVVRGTEAIPSPEPEVVIEADDTIVVVGTQEGVKAITALARG